MNDGQTQQPENVVALRSWEGRSANEALSEVNRELNVRLRCFPRWVKEGKLDQVDAQDRIDRLDAARHYLADLVAQGGKTNGVTSSGDMTAAG